jgi:hypothetical protein
MAVFIGGLAATVLLVELGVYLLLSSQDDDDVSW